MITSNVTLLFQGDSITDANRNRQDLDPNTLGGLGYGYCRDVAGHLLKNRPQDGLKIYNRGISRNRVVDLYARWKVDAINLKPDIISILIGVNDTGFEIKYQNGVEPPRYEKIYRMLLEWTRECLPKVKFIFCEPFVLSTADINDQWIADVNQRRSIVAQLAQDFDAPLVPFQRMFDEALKEAPAPYWSGDGVHPTPAGHKLMADTWLKTVGC